MLHDRTGGKRGVNKLDISHATTGCPESPNTVLRGYISGTPGTTEMGSVPKDASHPLVLSVFVFVLIVE
jgi:hypothetical protein